MAKITQCIPGFRLRHSYKANISAYLSLTCHKTVTYLYYLIRAARLKLYFQNRNLIIIKKNGP